jgi:hypothetical protein
MGKNLHMNWLLLEEEHSLLNNFNETDNRYLLREQECHDENGVAYPVIYYREPSPLASNRPKIDNKLTYISRCI